MNHFYTDIYAHHQLFRRPVLLGFYNDVMHFVAVLFLLLACPDVQGTSAKTGNSLIKMIAFRSVKTKTKSKVNLELKQLYKVSSTRMWANAQPDGRPAKHRWRPLFNAAKFG